SAGRRLLQPDDLAARRRRRGAERSRRPPDPGGRVAVELLLLPGGAAPAGVPVVVLPACTRRRLAPTGRPLPRLPEAVGQPRLPRARRSAVPQRRRGGSRRARLRGRHRPDARGVPGGALLGLVRHPAPRALRTAPAGYLVDTY